MYLFCYRNKMTVIFQSHHQFEFCDKILRSVTEDDGDSLMVATSAQEISLASLKVLQILSPILAEIVKTLPSTSIPLTLIVPDTDANTWKALMSLLTQGKVEVSVLGLPHLGPDLLHLLRLLPRVPAQPREQRRQRGHPHVWPHLSRPQLLGGLSEGKVQGQYFWL